MKHALIVRFCMSCDLCFCPSVILSLPGALDDPPGFPRKIGALQANLLGRIAQRKQ